MTHPDSTQPRRVSPDELTDGFRRLGLREKDRVVMHVLLSSMGIVDGGAAMVIHRLMNILGRNGVLLMPTFTSVTRHTLTHDNFTKVGCWCEGKENRHLPFIPDLQPDREIGEVAHRLCSWPASRRSRHPAFSFAAVGHDSDKLVRHYSLTDPLEPLKLLLAHDSFVLTIGVQLDSVTAIHVAEERYVPFRFVKERALTVGSTGPVWVDIVAPGCSAGFYRLADHIDRSYIRETDMGSARVFLYPMRQLVAGAERLLRESPAALSCGRTGCLSCKTAKAP